MKHTTHAARGVALLAFLLATAACGGSDRTTRDGEAAQTPAQSGAAAADGDQELADITEYRLTMEKVDRYFAAQRNIAQKAQAMSPAEREAVRARSANDDDDNMSVDDMVARVEREPMLKDAIEEAGLSAREYALLTMSMVQSAMAAGITRMRPNDNQDSLIREMQANPENVRFLIENEAEITRKQNAIAEEMNAIDGPDDDS